MAMVVLVRCFDGTCSVAMDSCLEVLAGEGLITSYLVNGEWVTVTKGTTLKSKRSEIKRPLGRSAASVL